MKLYDLNLPQYSDGGWDAEGRWAMILADFPDYLYMGHGSMTAHDKTTFSPLFGKTLQIVGGGPKNKILTNHVQGPCIQDFWQENLSNSKWGVGSRQQHPVNGEHTYTSVLLGGETMNAGTVAKAIWQSSTNSNLVFYATNYDGYDSNSWAQSWYYTHRYTYYYRYDIDTGAVDRNNENNTNHGNTYFYHEDDRYVYGVSAPVYPYYWYYRMYALNKTNLSRHYFGHSNRGHEYHLLYKHPSSNYILMFYNNYIANSVSTHYAGIAKYNLDNIEMVGNSDSAWRYKTQTTTQGHPNYPFTQIASDTTDPYNHHIGYHGHLYSDGTVISGKSNFHCYNKPALVTSDTLINGGDGVIRFYYARFDRNNDLVIDRINTPLGSDANANIASHNKKCRITQGSGTTKVTFQNYGGATSTEWGGSSAHAYQGMKLHFFEVDGSPKKGYLMFSGAYETPTGDGMNGHAIHVFKITNYATSITTSNVAETDSIDLEHIQTLELGEHIHCHFAPGKKMNKHICLMKSGQNPFLNWNESTERFEISHYINQNIVKIATLESGEVVTMHHDGTAGRSLHLESITLPNKVEIDLAQDKYTYQGTPISSSFDVSVKNYENTLIAKTVNLELIGDGVEFTTGGKTKTITSSSSATTTVNFRITKSTVVRVKATVSA